MAVAILGQLGYEVTASTGRGAELSGYLKQLGATHVIGRLQWDPDRPLGQQRWSGAVDTVGGATLSAVLSQTKYRCAVASIGVAGGASVATSVYPFILRGVRLLGVDSTLPQDVKGYPNDAQTQREHQHERNQIWERLSRYLTKTKLNLIHSA